MSTDTENKPAGSPEPFRRPVVWGRPPQTVFRAGPLPRGERLPPLPEPPRTSRTAAPRPGPGILSGSMIPQAAPAATPALRPAAEASFAPVPPRAADPDLTVRPLPPVEAAPLTARDRLLEPVRASTPVRPAATPTPAPVEPAPTVSPSPIAAGARRKPAGRTPLYAGAAAATVAVLGVGGWLMTRSPAETPPPVAPSAAAVLRPAIAPVEATPIVETAAAPVRAAPRPVTARPATARPAARAAPRRAPETSTAVAYAAPSSAPVTASTPAPAAGSTPAPPAITTVPLIEIAPAQPAGPPPTEAERQPTEPDAPIATRPQPIG